jgi:hypothetical protein
VPNIIDACRTGDPAQPVRTPQPPEPPLSRARYAHQRKTGHHIRGRNPPIRFIENKPLTSPYVAAAPVCRELIPYMFRIMVYRTGDRLPGRSFQARSQLPMPPAPGGIGRSRAYSSGDIDSDLSTMLTITAPTPTTAASATPLSSVAPITMSSPPASRSRGHHRVRRVRATRAALRRVGLLAAGAGKPSTPGTEGTVGAASASALALSLRRHRTVIGQVQQVSRLATRPRGDSCRGVPTLQVLSKIRNV